MPEKKSLLVFHTSEHTAFVQCLGIAVLMFSWPYMQLYMEQVEWQGQNIQLSDFLYCPSRSVIYTNGPVEGLCMEIIVRDTGLVCRHC